MHIGQSLKLLQKQIKHTESFFIVLDIHSNSDLTQVTSLVNVSSFESSIHVQMCMVNGSLSI